ncbi:tumor necrosis factor receptor superfamily member 18 isoform X1 [Lissotriton helveticus]
MEALPSLLGLAWILAAWCGGAMGVQCPKDQYPVLPPVQDWKCCNRCATEVEKGTPCPGVKDPDCKCTTAGYKCIDPECSSCLRVPTCGKGEKLVRSGTIHYRYDCQACSDGEYSDIENVESIKWTETDSTSSQQVTTSEKLAPSTEGTLLHPNSSGPCSCGSLGLETIVAGNQTHNAICGIMIVSKTAQESQGSPTTILALLTAVAIFILILGTIFLHLYIWRMKMEKLLIAKGGACITEHEHIHPLEDSWSCQLPEEEHGQRISEEASVKQSWVA